MAKAWGPGNPLWRWQHRRKKGRGRKKAAKKARTRKRSPGRSAPMARRRSRKGGAYRAARRGMSTVANAGLLNILALVAAIRVMRVDNAVAQAVSGQAGAFTAAAKTVGDAVTAPRIVAAAVPFILVAAIKMVGRAIHKRAAPAVLFGR